MHLHRVYKYIFAQDKNKYIRVCIYTLTSYTYRYICKKANRDKNRWKNT